MRTLSVFIEICSEQKYVGAITGESYSDASFKYDKEYLSSEYAVPISVSLPLKEEAFSPERTGAFFESLLPEGFSRRAVANWIKADERDYITILSALGKECLGAIKILEEETVIPAAYEELSIDRVRELAAEGATRSTQILMETHLSLAGASGKVGLYYDKDNDKWFLPIGDAPSTHIVKQSHVRYDQIVLNEQLCMLMAERICLNVPKSFIINTGKNTDNEVLFVTERFDRLLYEGRIINNLVSPLRLHQEDFAQALGIPSEKKYERDPSGYMKKMFDLLRSNSSDPVEDQKELFRRIVFNYLIGNTDCHIKNYALLYNRDLKGVRLAPAYDILSTMVYDITTDISFYIGGQINIRKIDRSSFLLAAEEVNMNSKMAEILFDDIANSFEYALNDATEQLVNEGFSAVKEMRERILKSGGYAMIS